MEPTSRRFKLEQGTTKLITNPDSMSKDNDISKANTFEVLQRKLPDGNNKEIEDSGAISCYTTKLTACKFTK